MSFRNTSRVVANELATGDAPNPRVEISNTPGRRIAFFTEHPAELQPGTIDSDYNPLDQSGSLVLTGPQVGPDGFLQAAIYLQSRGTDGTGDSYVLVDASQIEINGHIGIAEPIILDNAWQPPVLAGTWVDAPGGRCAVIRDAAGTVHIRGILSGGGAGVLLFTLSNSDHWPSQRTELLCHSGAGTGTESAIEILTNGQVRVFTNQASAAARLALDLSFTSL